MSKIEDAIKNSSECLEYDPDTGCLTRISASKFSKRIIGVRAGSINDRGYRQVRVNGQLIAEHRVIWYLVHGYLPAIIDHINGDKSDNRLCNLREATKSNNSMNRPKPSSNRSGFKGVCFNSGINKWQAQIAANGKKHYLGIFDSAQLAHTAYCSAAATLHKEFARTE